MEERIVYIDGKYQRESEARISIYDTALVTGEVVVEVCRTFNQKIYKLKEHLERFYDGLSDMSIDPGMSIDDMATITDKTLKKNLITESEEIEWQTIHYISRGLANIFHIAPFKQISPTIIIQCIPLKNRLASLAEKYMTGTNLIVSSQRVIPAEILNPQIKSRGRLDYILAKIQTNKINPGATAVLMDSKGNIVEGTGASLFFVYKGTILTTPSHKVLCGITRESVFHIARKLKIKIIETDISLEEAKKADEIFITSTIICLMHARSFEGKIIGRGECGEITKKIRNAFIKDVGVNFVKQARYYQKI